MSWGVSPSFPNAILHIDGDSFFASCEVAKNPSLRGKCVATGKERGIVSAATYEAKAKGVVRGMQLVKAKIVCPDLIVLPSDYETYSLFSKRMYDIVRRYTPAVEEYSIDECFADLTGMRRANRMSYPKMTEAIKNELDKELGITFSIGLSATKVLAKIGSKWEKPSGLTVIPFSDTEKYLSQTPIGNIWGIGENTAAYLNKYNIRTALDYVRKDEEWVREKVSKPYVEIWQELNGESVLPIDIEGRTSYSSISKTKTFTPPSTDSSFVFSQLSKNIENACIKARRWELVSPSVTFFLKTQDFRYQTCDVSLPQATAAPQEIIRAVYPFYEKLFLSRTQYRATGITLHKLTQEHNLQLDLFGAATQNLKAEGIFKSIDTLSQRFGKHTIFLGSSLKAMDKGSHVGARAEKVERVENIFKGETARKRLGVPSWGEIS